MKTKENSSAIDTNQLDLPIVQNRDLSLFCCRPPADMVLGNVREQLQIAVLFEPSACVLTWPLTGGRHASKKIAGPRVILIAPRQLHSCVWESAADVVVVHVTERWRRSLLPEGLPQSVMVPPALVHDGVLWQLAGGLRGLCHKDNAREIPFLPMVAHCVVARAVELLDAVAVSPIRRLSDIQLHAVQETVRTKLAYEIHAEDMARCVGLSLQYFNALFKNTVGITPAEYIHECRMQKAKELLSTGRHKIGAAARLVGFWDAGYFTARFRAHFGVSPRTLITQARTRSSIRPSFSSDRP